MYHTVVRKSFASFIPPESVFNGNGEGSTLIGYLGFSPAKLVRQSQIGLDILAHMFYRLNGTESWFTYVT